MRFAVRHTKWAAKTFFLLHHPCALACQLGSQFPHCTQGGEGLAVAALCCDPRRVYSGGWRAAGSAAVCRQCRPHLIRIYLELDHIGLVVRPSPHAGRAEAPAAVCPPAAQACDPDGLATSGTGIPCLLHRKLLNSTHRACLWREGGIRRVQRSLDASSRL